MIFFNKQEKEVLLPRTELALDEFVDSIAKEFDLPSGDDTYDAIATMILHLPQTRAYALRSYFGHGVLKSIANKVAYDKLTGFRIKREAEDKAKATESKTDASQGNLSVVPDGAQVQV